jgi:uncharacterized protein YgiM (DUF1202 family)
MKKMQDFCRKERKFIFILSFIISIMFFKATYSAAAEISDPAPLVVQSVVMLHKELAGYKSYGESDAAADVLCPGDSGSWSFSRKNFIKVMPKSFIIRAALDNNYETSKSNYSISISVGDKEVFNGCVKNYFNHGKLKGMKFDNWKELVVPADNNYQITIKNTSKLDSSHWIAIDWIRLLASVELEEIPTYTHKEQAEPIKLIDPEKIGKGIDAVVITQHDPLIIRVSPAAESKMIGKAEKGEHIEFFQKDDTQKWYYIRLQDGTMGYAYHKYIKLINKAEKSAVKIKAVEIDKKQTPMIEELENREPNAIVVTQTEPLIVRDGPGTNYEMIGKAAKGAHIEFLFKDDTGEWYYVRLQDGTMGYAYHKFIELIK